MVKSKWAAWNKLGDMSQAEAAASYVSLVAKLAPIEAVPAKAAPALAADVSERFAAAAKLSQTLDLGPREQLQLYALFKQAQTGPCTADEPVGADMVVESKWAAWKKLGDLSQAEAAASYVSLVAKLAPKAETEPTLATGGAVKPAAQSSDGADLGRSLRESFLGKPGTRWFDKSMTVIVTGDGQLANCFEHSWGDGMCISRWGAEVGKVLQRLFMGKPVTLTIALTLKAIRGSSWAS